jgi:hypothetical protein
LTVSELLFIGAWLLRFCGSRNIFYFPVKADFNGDGKSDILWQNSVNGQRVIWVMNGTSYSSYVDLGIVATSWKIVGSADFNADGNQDILWGNRVTGQRVIWLMNGTSYAVMLTWEPSR